MKLFSLCALAALLAVPARAQLHVGVDLGATTGSTVYGNGPAASLYTTAEWGVLRARLAVLDASYQSDERAVLNDDGTPFIGADGLVDYRKTGSTTHVASTLTVGLAVPVYRGVGVGVDVGARKFHAAVDRGTARSDEISWLPILAPEVFARGPRGSRLHLRTEALPPSGSAFTGERRGWQLLRLNGGVSVPLRF